MMDREAEAIFGLLAAPREFRCRQISVRRVEPKPRTREELRRFVLDRLATWRVEALDALYQVAPCRYVVGHGRS